MKQGKLEIKACRLLRHAMCTFKCSISLTRVGKLRYNWMHHTSKLHIECGVMLRSLEMGITTDTTWLFVKETHNFSGVQLNVFFLPFLVSAF